MSKIISLIIFAAIFISGLSQFFQSKKKPSYEKITISDLDSLGVKSLKYVEITEGWSTGDFVSTQRENSSSVLHITYPVVNMNKLRSESDTSKFRTKLIVYDAKADSTGFGPVEVKGKIQSQLSGKELALMQESYEVDPNHLVVRQGWEKPSGGFALIMMLVGGGLFFINLRSFFPSLLRGKTKRPMKTGGNLDDQLV